MIGVEWISYEIGALVVGSIDSIQLALSAIIMQLITIAYSVSIGSFFCIIHVHDFRYLSGWQLVYQFVSVMNLEQVNLRELRDLHTSV